MEIVDDVDSEDDKPKGRAKALTPKEAKDRTVRLAQEAAQLRSALAIGDLSSVIKRVAWVLNGFPHTRDSDVSLTLKYWEQYQPGIFNAHGMMPQDLFSLERFVTVVRARAKIQNDYGLFPSSGRVKERRRKIEDEIKEAVVEDRPGRRILFVYADETGKNQEIVSVAAVWAMTASSLWPINRAVLIWREISNFGSREIHFTELRKHDAGAISSYLDAIIEKKELLSFKVISLVKATTSRPIDEVVHRLHEFMVVRGIEHEIERGRITLPHEVALTVDAEQSLDDIARADIKDRIAAAFNAAHPGELAIASVEVAESHKSELVQLADLVAGSINRRLNHKGERNHKDDIADMVIDRLHIQLAPGEIPNMDATVLLAI